MAVSGFILEANALGRNVNNNCSTYTKSYSSHTFDYPYPKAVSVSAEDQGMEYPMIWNVVLMKTVNW
jgi:hypothetical protein